MFLRKIEDDFGVKTGPGGAKILPTRPHSEAFIAHYYQKYRDPYLPPFWMVSDPNQALVLVVQIRPVFIVRNWLCPIRFASHVDQRSLSAKAVALGSAGSKHLLAPLKFGV